MRGTARENRVVIYLEDDDYAVLTKRADRRQKSSNLYAKDLLLDALKDDNDGVLQALNVLATSMAETEVTVKRLEKNAGNDFRQLGEMVNEALDKLEGKGR